LLGGKAGAILFYPVAGVVVVVLESFLEFGDDRAGGIQATPTGTDIEPDADDGDPSHLRVVPTVQLVDCIPLADTMPIVETLQQVVDDLRRFDMQSLDGEEEAGTNAGVRLIRCPNPADWVVQPPADETRQKRSA
jgi:hypothetical protein